MTKPADTPGTTNSNPPGPPPSQSSETVPPFGLDPKAESTPATPLSDKLFSLFAQALFSGGGAGESAPGALPPGATNPGSSPEAKSKLKALVVGFSEYELTSICPAVRSFTFDTMTAPSADQALEVIALQAVSVVVVDWDAPATHALVFAQTVRKMKIEQQPLIIGLATQLTDTLKASARGTGFDRICEKPLTRDLLIDCLRAKGLSAPNSPPPP